MTDTSPQTEATVEIVVDGIAVPAVPGEMLIAACERAGNYIPRFCYHPRMTPVGMCRMCLVEVDAGRGFALQPSCMVPVTPGMKVRTDSEPTRKAQDGVLEFLLINHPLDCPVCDKGGECPLQDQTMAYGPGESRFVEEKRHFVKPIAISNNVYLDRERCILCDRCTRFADEVAGDALIQFMGRGSNTEVNTFPDEPFASYFSGNTVQICPVGALTAKPYRFKARPWDLTESMSTAWVDSLGSRIAVQSSRNRVLRVQGVDCDAVNWGWLSDKERFAFEALNSPDRLRTPLLRVPSAAKETNGAHSVAGDDGSSGAAYSEEPWSDFVEASWGVALDRAAAALKAADPDRIGVIGGARLSNESQWAWAKLIKGVIGSNHFDAQLDDGVVSARMTRTAADTRGGTHPRRATINDACNPGGTVILVGFDPKEELGSLYLRLRHAILNDGVTLIEVASLPTGLSDLATRCIRPMPGKTLEAVLSLTAELAKEHRSRRSSSDDCDTEGETGDLGSGITVIAGRTSLAEGRSETDNVVWHLIGALPFARFLLAERRGNITGAVAAGLTPGFHLLGVGLPSRGEYERALEKANGGESTEHALEDLTGRELIEAIRHSFGSRDSVRSETATDSVSETDWDDRCERRLHFELRRRLKSRGWERFHDWPFGSSTSMILDSARSSPYVPAGLEVLVLLGSDPLNDCADGLLAEDALAGAPTVIAVDLFANDSIRRHADVVLAAAGPTESEGTFTNIEGRVSLMSQCVTAPGTARPDWEIAAELAARLDADLGFDDVEDIRAEMAYVSPIHASVTTEALTSAGTEGLLLDSLPLPRETWQRMRTRPKLHQPHVYRPISEADKQLRLVVTRRMYDDGEMLRHCPSSRALVREPQARVNPSEVSRLGLTPEGMVVLQGHPDNRHYDPEQVDAIGQPQTGSEVGSPYESYEIDETDLEIEESAYSANPRRRLTMRLVADASVPTGVVAIDWMAPGAPANTLIDHNSDRTLVTITPVSESETSGDGQAEAPA